MLQCVSRNKVSITRERFFSYILRESDDILATLKNAFFGGESDQNASGYVVCKGQLKK